MGRPGMDPNKYIGQTFGRLTIIGYDHEKKIDVKHREHYFLCQCTCGNQTVVSLKNLTNSKHPTTSCGCYVQEINRERIRNMKLTHGLTDHRLYNIWRNTKARCYNPNNGSYSDYGARGIKMCDEWLNDFKTFYDWAMANGYSDDLTISRKNPDGDYCPENCCWTTDKAQQSTRRNNVYITYIQDFSNIGKGVVRHTFTKSDWARIFNIDHKMIDYHLKHRNGRTINEIMEYLMNYNAQKQGMKSLGFVIPDGVIPFPDKYEQSIHD